MQLFSSNPAVAQVPSETVVNARASSGAFNLSTSPVSTNTTVTITARWFGVSRTTTVTVKPGVPPAADVVKIKKATWKNNPLQVTVRSNAGGSATASTT